MDEVDLIKEELLCDFCPPIDQPTFYAICSDYDLGNQGALKACLSNLEIIKAAAVDADITTFDASGTGGFANIEPGTSGESGSSQHGAVSASRDIESITTGLSNLAWDDLSAEGQCLDDTSEASKLLWLRAMFPDIAEAKIYYRLQKCRANLTRTIDELLNLSFILQDESGVPSAIPRGIDGFTKSEENGSGRKGRGKGKRRLRANESTSINTDTSRETRNVWAAMGDDIGFVCDRSILDAQSVTATYESQNKSLGRTISSIASKYGASLESIESPDSLQQLQFIELRDNFRTISDAQLHGLLIVSGNVLSAAHELATAMVTSPEVVSNENLQILARYAPVDLESERDRTVSFSSKPWIQVSHTKARSLAISKAGAGVTAFSQAATAHQKGKSAHLMGGAAAHYAALGHENIQAARELSAIAAESLVMSQSNSKMLDLHGVSVADAVRIAKVQVAGWWHDLGDTKYASGGGGPTREGYRVVTGVGRHSRDGAPRIGPAVSRMLVKEGWKVTVGQGEILITGRARRS